MIRQTTLSFLTQLKDNNNRDWFEANRKTYESARQEYLLFVTEMLAGLKGFDTTLAGLESKKCMFRINRDVRFSKNKDPYKTNFGSYFNKGGKGIECAGYYFHLEPGGSFIGGGYWMPQAPELKKIRSEIDYNVDEFLGILNEKELKKLFGNLGNDQKLSRPPQGYGPDNPAIEYLKLKSFVVTAPITDAELLDKSLTKKILAHFKAMVPLVHFLNRAID